MGYNRLTMSSPRLVLTLGLLLALMSPLAAPAPALAEAAPSREQAPGNPGGEAAPGGATGAAAEPADPLEDPGFLARARAYTRGNYLLYLLETAWTLLLLWWLAFSGMSSRAWAWIRARFGEGFRSSLLYVAGLVVFLSLITLPIDFYDGFVREHAYGFSTQTAASWLHDRLKGLGITILLTALLALPLYALIRRFRRSWWILGAALTGLFATFLVAIAPVAIDPIFNDFTPLEERDLRDTILDLARRNGIRAEEVFQVDASSRSVHDNAYVTGILGTQRIVLYDTLVENYTRDEIAYVMGHEIGHYVLNHIWKGLALTWLLIAGIFWIVQRALRWSLARFADRTGFRAPGDLATLPMLLFTVTLTLFVTLPAQSGYSRWIESEADRFALRAVDHPEAGPGAFRKMAVRNLSDPFPPAIVEWFMYSHPSVGKRIRAAEAYLRERAGAGLQSLRSARPGEGGLRDDDRGPAPHRSDRDGS